MGRSTQTQSSIYSENIHSPWERLGSSSGSLVRNRHGDFEETSQTTGQDGSTTSSSVLGERLTRATDFQAPSDKQDSDPGTALGHQIASKSPSQETNRVSSTSNPGDDVFAGTSEDEYDSYLFDSSPATPENQVLGPIFAEVREDLATVALHRFTDKLLKTSPSTKRPRRSLSPRTRKRIKLHSLSKHAEVEQRTMPEEEDTIFVDLPGSESRVFACPFYIRNRKEHMRCLSRADLRSIEDLKRHLWNLHQRPPYCPTCGQTFNRASDRDDHIRARTCQKQDPPVPEGITEDQMHQLARRAKPGTLESSQWLDIWHVVFPVEDGQAKSLPPQTPYLVGELESMVCVARTFWLNEGPLIIAEFLETRGLRAYDVPDEERNLDALHRLILNELIDGLLASSGNDDGDPHSSTANVVLGLWTAWRQLREIWSRK
ncbi:putative C2H2-type domain-containing protein [Seiridium unicorne]|uniref:C2H2-type domain-containing protein n=1 Tax=Seiridium unicorne TaxID=138068 RepID=A0ABR2ULW5_9PEZI